jgi:hypothetical protein
MDGQRVQLDERGFVNLDGCRLPVRFIPDRRTLEFCDKNPFRSAERGTRLIEVDLLEFLLALLLEDESG